MLPAAAYYDNLASIYDQATEGKWTPNLILEPFLLEVADTGSKALDIGSGTGQTIALLRKAGITAIITGIDVSQNMLDACGRKHPDAELHLGQLLDVGPQFANAVFDIITCIGTFEFVSDPGAFLAEASRLLSGTGKFFLTYEPIIKFHEIQDAPESEVVPGDAASKAGIASEGFVSYRRDPQLIEDLLLEAGLRKTIDVEFVAYRKSSVPIIYHLIVVELLGGKQ